MARATFSWFGLFGSARTLTPGNPIIYRCFCDQAFQLRRVRAVSGDNLSSAFEALPAHAAKGGAPCAYESAQPRLDPRPQEEEQMRFGSVAMDPKKAAERLTKELSRTTDLFPQSNPLVAAE